MRDCILALSHNDPCSGQIGINHCLEPLQRQYYWPGMASEVQLWIAKCEPCNRLKPQLPSQRAPMESIKVEGPMELWAMDVMGPLSMANQRADTTAKAFVDEVASRHGISKTLLTDQDRNFEADFMKKVFQLVGVTKPCTSPYHPQTDGQVERFRTLKGILTAYVNDHNDWDVHLPLALFAYRTSIHHSSGVTPFEVVYGRKAVSPFTLMAT